MFCKQCGKELVESVSYCSRCGEKVKNAHFSTKFNGELWNPSVASNWSVVFSPIFGSFIQAVNWRNIGELSRINRGQTTIDSKICNMRRYPVSGYRPLVHDIRLETVNHFQKSLLDRLSHD